MRHRFLPFPCLGLVRSGTASGRRHASRPPKHSVRSRNKTDPATDPTLEAWTAVRALPVFSVASVSAAVGVFAAIAASVAGGAAPAAAFALQGHSASPASDLPFPVAALLFDALFAVARIAFPVAAGTSGPASHCLYLEERAVPRVEVRERASACSNAPHCSVQRYSPDARHCSRGAEMLRRLHLADFRHGWAEASNVRRVL